MEGRSTCLSGCKSSGRAGNGRKELDKCPDETDLFLLYIWLVSPAPKIIVTVVLSTLKSIVPYIAQIKSAVPYSAQIEGKEDIMLEKNVILKWCQKLIFTCNVCGPCIIISDKK